MHGRTGLLSWGVDKALFLRGKRSADQLVNCLDELLRLNAGRAFFVVGNSQVPVERRIPQRKIA